jgi:hypothetical protein
MSFTHTKWAEQTLTDIQRFGEWFEYGGRDSVGDDGEWGPWVEFIHDPTGLALRISTANGVNWGRNFQFLLSSDVTVDASLKWWVNVRSNFRMEIMESVRPIIERIIGIVEGFEREDFVADAVATFREKWGIDQLTFVKTYGPVLLPEWEW